MFTEKISSLVRSANVRYATDEDAAYRTDICSYSGKAGTDIIGAVAQVVERKTENLCVGGSTPPSPAGHVLEWFKGQVCKTSDSWVRIPP